MDTKEAIVNYFGEMATTNLLDDGEKSQEDKEFEQETNVDGENEPLIGVQDEDSRSSSKHSSLETAQTKNQEILPPGWERHIDKLGPYYWHVPTGLIQRTKPSSEPRKESLVLCNDDEEINQNTQKTSSDDDEFFESGAALTVDDTSEATFVVYPMGCCEFDETQLIPNNSSKAIQKCILRLTNQVQTEENVCWGLDQSQPILMRLLENLIQFTELKTQTLLRSQPIPTIKCWAVDDDNNFAFVVEERPQQQQSSYENDYFDSLDYALLSQPTLVCYVFRSMDDDDMSCQVAAKLNAEMNRYKEQVSHRITKSTRLQQMVEQQPDGGNEIEDDDDDLEATSEMTMNVRYIGKVQVPRPTGIDILNAAIDKCLEDASKNRVNRSKELTTNENETENRFDSDSPLIDVKLHVSPSSVIVENELTGEIIVECRIRYLTFMAISRRDIRWFGFIMQDTTTKTFIAHCLECHPTAGHVCAAIQKSCTKMYEKVVKTSQQPETISIIPTSSRIRDTLVKTFARMNIKS